MKFALTANFKQAETQAFLELIDLHLSWVNRSHIEVILYASFRWFASSEVLTISSAAADGLFLLYFLCVYARLGYVAKFVGIYKFPFPLQLFQIRLRVSRHSTSLTKLSDFAGILVSTVDIHKLTTSLITKSTRTSW